VILDDVLLTASQRHFVEVLGATGHSRSGYRYDLTEEGRARARPPWKPAATWARPRFRWTSSGPGCGASP
jgi:hypothetical protein